MLSDIDSEVIAAYGILNTSIEPDDAFLWGIPYPGAFVTDEDGVVVSKFFHDTYKKRDSPELLIDAALGRVDLSADAPRVDAGDDEVRISVAVQGGKGTIRQGIRRHLVIRFELAEGLHIYGEPVPEGMIPARVEVTGPPGFVVEEPILPPTTPLRLDALDLELPVWGGTVDFVIPFYANGELASETRPLDTDQITIEVSVRYQACDDAACLLPKTEKLSLDLALDVVDVPNLGMHTGHGQREAGYSNAPHLRRLFLRKGLKNPLGLLKFFAKSIRLELAARRRAKES